MKPRASGRAKRSDHATQEAVIRQEAIHVVAAFDALEAGQPEALVDDWTRQVKSGLSDDQNLIYPGVEEQFNAAVPA